MNKNEKGNNVNNLKNFFQNKRSQLNVPNFNFHVHMFPHIFDMSLKSWIKKKYIYLLLDFENEI